MKFEASEVDVEDHGRSEPGKVVYLSPPIHLARVLGRTETGWRVSAGGSEREVTADASVDPALLEAAIADERRVVLEAGVIVGSLATHRSLEIDREGGVEAALTRLVVDVREQALLRTVKAYVRLAPSEVELYGGKVVTRAREVAKTLARLISLN